MSLKKISITLLILIASLFGTYKLATSVDFNTTHQIGDQLDELDGVAVYYNGAVNHVKERNVTPDNYNLGLRYQCVEFVKRYYYQHYQHKMPDSYGHAKHFFDAQVAHGKMNKQRGLKQFRNHHSSKPQKGDLLVYRAHLLNPYGHVAIVSAVDDDSIEIIQQNPGAFAPSRERYALRQEGDIWHVEQDLLLGWLRL
jgi:surface antigen